MGLAQPNEYDFLEGNNPFENTGASQQTLESDLVSKKRAEMGRSNEKDNWVGAVGTVDAVRRVDSVIASSSLATLQHQVNASEQIMVLQKWEGYVTDFNDREITARVKDMIALDTPEEELIFDILDVTDSDKELIQKGAVFYWFIGYSDRSQGRERVSRFTFRRLPAWSKSEIEKAQRESDEFNRLIKDKKSQTAS